MNLLNPFWFGGGGSPVIQAGLLFDLNSGSTVSYSGTGQTWSNVTLDINYDTWLGQGSGVSADPVFNGTAGAGNATNFWSFSGATYFTNKAAITTFLRSIHFSTPAKPFTVQAVVKWPTTTQGTVFATNASDGSLTGGVQFEAAQDQIKMRLWDGGNPSDKNGALGLSGSLWWVVTWGFAGSGVSASFILRNSTYSQVSAADEFTLTNGGGANSNATGWWVGNRSDNSENIPNTAELGRIIAYDRLLTYDEAVTNVNTLAAQYPP